MNKSYHKSELWELGGRQGETKKLPLAAGAPCRRRRRKKGATVSLNSPAWESCELHPVAVTRDQDRKQRSEDGREATVDYYKPWLQNARLSHSPHPPTLRGTSPHILQDWISRRPRGIWVNATETVTNTDREWAWLNIYRKKGGIIKTLYKAGIQEAYMLPTGNPKKNAIVATS